MYYIGDTDYFSSYVDDFVLLQSCDHVIMTVGTFGWWASQRGGTVMYYKDPFPIDSDIQETQPLSRRLVGILRQICGRIQTIKGLVQ